MIMDTIQEINAEIKRLQELKKQIKKDKAVQKEIEDLKAQVKYWEGRYNEVAATKKDSNPPEASNEQRLHI